MNVFKRLAAVMILFAAVLQWVAVVDRSWAAAWEWYKFAGHGGGGVITVGTLTQVVFFAISTALAAIGFVLSGRGDRDMFGRASKWGAISLVVGAVAWGALLFSPLVVFR